MLAGLDAARDTHSKIALFPAHFFVWLDELKAAHYAYHYFVSDPSDFDPHDAFDIDPATHPYDDLLSECPDFMANPYLTGDAKLTGRELRKQKTQEKHAKWQARAMELKKENPKRTDVPIAKLISKESIAEGSTYMTILRKISTHKT